VSEQEKPAPEIRGGNRPTDYIPESKFHGAVTGTGESGTEYVLGEDDFTYPEDDEYQDDSYPHDEES